MEDLNTALDVEFDSFDLGRITVRSYFEALLKTLWKRGEGFSGKRPFGGGTAWKEDVYGALIQTGYIEGAMREDGYVERIENRALAERFVFDLIHAMCSE